MVGKVSEKGYIINTLLKFIKLSTIATTQFSPELDNIDWGGSIIAKINHHTTTPHHTTPCDYFFDQYRQVSSSVVQYRVAQCNL